MKVPKLIAVTHDHLTMLMKNFHVSWEQVLADDDFRLEQWEEIFWNIGSKCHSSTGIKKIPYM